MKALKFSLSGKTAFFKRPEINQRFYFTFSHIHKVALLGLLGCIVGLDGYNQQSKEDEYPEFYRELKNIKLSIVPKGTENGIFKKKIISFNNSVGYASREQGNNLIVREQVLEDVEWDIYILDMPGISKNIIENIRERKTIFTPYLGKNEHLADIKNIEIVELENITDKEFRIDSLSITSNFEVLNNDDDFDEDSDGLWYNQDRLPIGLDSDNYYMMEDFIYTNSKMKVKEDNTIVYKCKYGNLSFI